MEKIIMVFDEFLSLRMFVAVKEKKLFVEYLSAGENKKEDEVKIEKINDLIEKGDLSMTGYAGKIDEKEAVIYKRKISPEDPEFLTAVKQGLTGDGMFARIIPAETKEMFLNLEKKNIGYKNKKEIFSKILNSSGEEMVKIAEAFSKASELDKKIKNNQKF